MDFTRPLVLTLFCLASACASNQGALENNGPQAAASVKSSSSSSSAGTQRSAPPLTAETIKRIVASHYDEVKTCYESELSNDASLSGIVELELTIKSDGTITEGRLLKDGLGSSNLNLCLVRKMVDWQFPPHADESVTIEFPFSFSPKKIGPKN